MTPSKFSSSATVPCDAFSEFARVTRVLVAAFDKAPPRKGSPEYALWHSLKSALRTYDEAKRSTYVRSLRNPANRPNGGSPNPR